jgi:pimeloyl-ACP methyl ester carboxylesterase
VEPSWVVPSIDGTRVSAYELGGRGEAVVIAHATGFCGPAYRRLAAGLTEEFRVVALDFRGHGRSSRAIDLDLRWERMKEDVIAVVDRVGAPVHGFGHSMGGAALLMAAAELPSSFASLFLFEPVVFVSVPQLGKQLAMSDVARRRRSEFGSRAEALARYAANPPFDSLLAGCLSDYVEHGFLDAPGGGVELACRPQHEVEIFEYGVESTVDRVGSPPTPVMLAVGHDEVGPSQLGAPLSQILPNAGLKRYAHIDHLGPFQDPAAVARDTIAHVAANRVESAQGGGRR